MVKCQRLIFEAGEGTFTLDLHPRLTVIAGVSRAERDGLINELLGAMAGTRGGVHLELHSGAGRHLALLRPDGAAHQMIDIDEGLDVTSEFRDHHGVIDLLAQCGLDLATARQTLRVGGSELSCTPPPSAELRMLARIDQDVLWATADHAARTERALEELTGALQPAETEGELIDRVEHRHHRFERAIERDERARANATRIGATAAAIAVPAALTMPLFALPLLSVSTAAAIYSVVCRRSVREAEEAAAAALAEAGASTYIGFHIQRVNGMLADAEHRKQLAHAADEHRRALEAWRDVAGHCDVRYALANRDEISAAAGVERDLRASRGDQPGFGSTGELGTHLANALIARLTAVRSLAPSGESLPIVLDDPFIELDANVKPTLLELLGRWSGDPQIVFLTSDADVTSWARVEALTGDISIIEAGTHVESKTPPPPPPPPHHAVADERSATPSGVRATIDLSRPS